MPTKLTLASDLHSTPANKNIGFPGWPEHNLDCVLVLGGQLTEGGLHRPPFFYCHSSCIANRSLFASRFPLTKDVASRKRCRFQTAFTFQVANQLVYKYVHRFYPVAASITARVSGERCEPSVS
jgi:hypothetical protein